MKLFAIAVCSVRIKGMEAVHESFVSAVSASNITFSNFAGAMTFDNFSAADMLAKHCEAVKTSMDPETGFVFLPCEITVSYPNNLDYGYIIRQESDHLINLEGKNGDE